MEPNGINKLLWGVVPTLVAVAITSPVTYIFTSLNSNEAVYAELSKSMARVETSLKFIGEGMDELKVRVLALENRVISSVNK